MKNLNSMSFEQNRFFTGKLLTAEDLDQEQQYSDDITNNLPDDDESDWQFAQGRVQISVPSGTGAGQCLFSSEIDHGLGLGEVEIILHVLQEGFSYSGSENIFPEEEKKMEVGARLNLNSGTFMIGIRLLEAILEEEVWVGWTAIRKRSRNEFKRAEPRLYIQPGVVNIRTRETVRLNAVCVNVDRGAKIIWKVESTPDGGTVDEDGTYQAPKVPGVYEVSCVLEDWERARAVAFIVVRE